MATLNTITESGIQKFGATINITKQNSTVLDLSTKASYVDKDIKLTFNVRGATGTIGGTATNGATAAEITNVNNINTIANLAGKTAGVDYWQIKATAAGTDGSYKPKYTITQSGWVNNNIEATTATTISVSSDTTGKSLYIPKAEGSISLVAGSGVCTYDSSNSSHVTVSDTDTSGVKVVFKGKGSLTATAKITSAGYTPINNSFATANSTSSNEASESKYITGVELVAGKSFSITVPNGSASEKITFVFTVDNDNNVSVQGP